LGAENIYIYIYIYIYQALLIKVRAADDDYNHHFIQN